MLFAGVKNQLRMSGDKRNTVIQANRTAKTVIEVFDRILNAESISQDDLHLIIERITVFDDAIEVKLKSDVQALLCCGVCDSDELPEDAVVVQESANRPPKELKMLVDAPKTDNVISSGDPLEIFTDKDGEVIFKKYSPNGELKAIVEVKFLIHILDELPLLVSIEVSRHDDVNILNIPTFHQVLYAIDVVLIERKSRKEQSVGVEIVLDKEGFDEVTDDESAAHQHIPSFALLQHRHVVDKVHGVLVLDMAVADQLHARLDIPAIVPDGSIVIIDTINSEVVSIEVRTIELFSIDALCVERIKIVKREIEIQRVKSNSLSSHITSSLTYCR